MVLFELGNHSPKASTLVSLQRSTKGKFRSTKVGVVMPTSSFNATINRSTTLYCFFRSYFFILFFFLFWTHERSLAIEGAPPCFGRRFVTALKVGRSQTGLGRSRLSPLCRVCFVKSNFSRRRCVTSSSPQTKPIEQLSTSITIASRSAEFLSPILSRQESRTCRLRFSGLSIFTEPQRDWRRRGFDDRCFRPLAWKAQ